MVDRRHSHLAHPPSITHKRVKQDEMTLSLLPNVRRENANETIVNTIWFMRWSHLRFATLFFCVSVACHADWVCWCVEHQIFRSFFFIFLYFFARRVQDEKTKMFVFFLFHSTLLCVSNWKSKKGRRRRKKYRKRQNKIIYILCINTVICMYNSMIRSYICLARGKRKNDEKKSN